MGVLISMAVSMGKSMWVSNADLQRNLGSTVCSRRRPVHTDGGCTGRWFWFSASFPETRGSQAQEVYVPGSPVMSGKRREGPFTAGLAVLSGFLTPVAFRVQNAPWGRAACGDQSRSPITQKVSIC